MENNNDKEIIHQDPQSLNILVIKDLDKFINLGDPSTSLLMKREIMN